MKKALPVVVTVLFAVVLAVTLTLVRQAQDADKISEPLLLFDDKMPVEETLSPLEQKRINQGLWSERKKRVKGKVGKDSPQLFAEWHNGIRTRDGAAGPDYDLNYQVRELLKARGVKDARELASLQSSSQLNWVERGPGNVAGRTRGLLVYPGDPEYGTWYAGSVGGGVWKTEDAGQTWMNLTADLPNLATSTLAWSPNFPNTIYVGTGEGFGNVDQIDGSGIWKSTDAGMTWAQLAETATNPDFDNVMRMVVDPDDPDVIVAALAPGFNQAPSVTSTIYRSEDGGATWTKVYDSGTSNVEHLIANPLNFNTQYAARNGVGVIKSTDGGQTWFDASEGIGEVVRIELAIAPTDTNIIYASAQGGATGSILYSSTDAGASWFPHSDANGNDAHWLAGQGWYDNTIAVNPYDSEEVFVGGVNLWRLNVVAGTDTSAPQVYKIDRAETDPFLAFVNWGGRFAGGGLDTGPNFFGATALGDTDFVSIELRFGPGKSQKAHRFNPPDGPVPGSTFTFADYTDVPFEVWDIDNNRQLMVSYRDTEDNGTFDLEDRATAPMGIDREYVFINAIPYDPDAPNDSLAQTAGMVYKNIYAFWPEAPFGLGSVDPSTLTEDATFRINYGRVVTRSLTTTNITDAYDQFGGDDPGVHVDHHNITIVKTDEANQEFRFLNGNDGGVAFSDDGLQSFSQTGIFEGFQGPADVTTLFGYNTSQFYGVDKVNGADRYIGGTQDNGSFVSPVDADAASAWEPAPSGDGFEALAHYGNPNWFMETSQFNNVLRSKDGGTSWENVSPPDRGSGSGPFFTKLAKSKQDPDLTFAVGASGVWRTDNFGDIWTLTPMPNGFSGTSSFSQVKTSLVTPQIVWTAQSMSPTSPPFVSTDGGLTFAATEIYDEVQMGRISGLETHPTEDSTAFVLFSFKAAPKVLRTQDLGQTWEDLSGFGTNTTSSNGFPDVAVYSLLVMPFDTDMMWAGTEIGLFETTDGGASWAFADNGLPAAAVYDMVIVNDEIVVATHGRGVWTVAMPELEGHEPPEATRSPRFVDLAGGANGLLNATIRLASPYDSSAVFVDGEPLVDFAENAEDTTFAFDLQIEFETERDTVSVGLAAWKNGQLVRSPVIDAEVFSLEAARAFYATTFDDASEDLLFDGLSLETPSGFGDPALHSLHPYPAPGSDGNLTAQLKFPIIVSGENSQITFDEIVLVEPGDPGSVFGDDNFWDYVIVEGSADNAVTWVPLAPGYDARADDAWEAAFNNGEAGDPSMYRSRTLDLRDVFSEGDQVLIRFRLFFDAFVSGWGWAIDNLAVQTDPVSVESGEVLPTVFSLSQNYPNPFNPTTKINYDLPKDAEVKLQVFNVVGQKVRDLILNEKQTAGRYTIQWDGKDDTGRPVASGLYLYRIKAGDFVKSHKMTLLK